MTKIGIISGNGQLPLSIGLNLISKNYKIIFFGIKNFANPILYKNYDYVEITISSFSDILSKLKEKQIDKIIMVGKISRPTLKDIKFDLNTASLIKEYFLESKGDDQLLKSISNFFLKKGYPLFDWKNTASDLFASEDNLTKIKPDKIAKKNLIKGLNIFKLLGQTDIGQSLIIQNQLILGFECIEGTDQLIKRCFDYKKTGDKGVLLKLSKYNQHNSLDLPTIGINTVKNLKKYQYDGLFIEKNQCIIMDRSEVVKFCNENKLFLSTINKID